MRCQLRLTFKMEREETIELELSIDELVDVSLGINHVQGFDLNVDLHLINVDDVAPPIIKLSNANGHASQFTFSSIINI
jgi:hypothetical protein